MKQEVQKQVTQKMNYAESNRKAQHASYSAPSVYYRKENFTLIDFAGKQNNNGIEQKKLSHVDIGKPVIQGKWDHKGFSRHAGLLQSNSVNIEYRKQEIEFIVNNYFNCIYDKDKVKERIYMYIDSKTDKLISNMNELYCFIEKNIELFSLVEKDYNDIKPSVAGNLAEYFKENQFEKATDSSLKEDKSNTKEAEIVEKTGENDPAHTVNYEGGFIMVKPFRGYAYSSRFSGCIMAVFFNSKGYDKCLRANAFRFICFPHCNRAV